MIDYAVVQVSEVSVVANGGGAEKGVDGGINGGGPDVGKGGVVRIRQPCEFDEVFEVGV